MPNIQGAPGVHWEEERWHEITVKQTITTVYVYSIYGSDVITF
jgi:hypothetical protein